MIDITLSHYAIRGITPTPWSETWDNLTRFAEKMAPKLEPMAIKLRLRQVVMEEVTQESLMSGNMVTIEAPELNVPETPIEDLLMLDLYYSECSDCVTPEGTAFSCRTFLDFDDVPRQALPETFFLEATLRVAFQAEGDGCSCSDCSSCGGGCGDDCE